MFGIFKKNKEAAHLNEPKFDQLATIIYKHFKNDPDRPLYMKCGTTINDTYFIKLSGMVDCDARPEVLIRGVECKYLENLKSASVDDIETHRIVYGDFVYLDNFDDYYGEYHFVNEQDVVDYMVEYTKNVDEKYNDLEVNGVYSLDDVANPLNKDFFVKVTKKIEVDEHDLYFATVTSNYSKKFNGEEVLHKVSDGFIGHIIPARKLKIVKSTRLTHIRSKE